MHGPLSHIERPELVDRRDLSLLVDRRKERGERGERGEKGERERRERREREERFYYHLCCSKQASPSCS